MTITVVWCAHVIRSFTAPFTAPQRVHRFLNCSVTVVTSSVKSIAATSCCRPREADLVALSTPLDGPAPPAPPAPCGEGVAGSAWPAAPPGVTLGRAPSRSSAGSDGSS
eukprot:6440694-Pyramimonas_sp.AAC.2